MRLKEIKPMTAVLCRKEEEVKALVEMKGVPGTMRFQDLPLWIGFGEKGKFYSWVPVEKENGEEYYGEKGYNCIDFSDLILPELTAEELLEIYGKICEENTDIDFGCMGKCPFCGHGMRCNLYMTKYPERVIEACMKWKADHEKKEQEFEWIHICRIIEGNNGKKRCVHEVPMDKDAISKHGIETEAQLILFDYISEHEGEYFAVVEHICRVKEPV